ncbi:Hydroxyacylglutathione hydrolase [Variovorax sp. PBS-H4]|uniref:hydroxyacylglutathione hydrolase n=1 Tax=Variovorax sp. PBS-H4 TaxID=434008 RepID=UPI001318F023|nr:hydroxyacylglutathione hydrolase [Variovorax sp. PBS-H4]VTU37343.1 Hydroxyacylglutathione hydrolase [Variovorax sp. PBS-H4]
MPISVSPVPALADNYIWVIDDGREAVVVDPGEAPPVVAHLRRRGLKLSAVLLTHHHYDHVGGVEALISEQAFYSGSGVPPVYGPAGSGIATVTSTVGEGMVIRAARGGSMAFSVLEVPGHTLDHVVYLAHPLQGGDPARLFCGDTLFSCGCGRVFEGTHEQMVASLAKLRSLPPQTLVYPAHEYTLLNILFALQADVGNEALALWADEAARLRHEGFATLPTTIGKESAVNPFLRLDDADVKVRARQSFGAAGEDPVSVFAALRMARNVFKPSAMPQGTAIAAGRTKADSQER